MYIYLVIEDELSETITRKIFGEYFNNIDFHIVTIGKRGKGYIKKRINEFNNLNNDMPFFILVGLDLDSCAPELTRQWLKRACRRNLVFRVAVREVETWLLADIHGFSNYLNMDHAYVSKEVNHPDELLDPKSKLLSLVERSRKRKIIEDIVKRDGTSLKQGPGYNARLSDYIVNVWNMKRARDNSNSLDRAINALRNFNWNKTNQ